MKANRSLKLVALFTFIGGIGVAPTCFCMIEPTEMESNSIIQVSLKAETPTERHTMSKRNNSHNNISRELIYQTLPPIRPNLERRGNSQNNVSKFTYGQRNRIIKKAIDAFWEAIKPKTNNKVTQLDVLTQR